MPTDFTQLLHELRSYELRTMPRGASTFLSAGCSGGWFFRWITENYGPVKRHIGLEYYSPEPADLPPEVEWIANTVGNMKGVRDGEVDLLFSGQNIEHLWPEDIVGFLMESHRVLRRGGTIVMDSPNRKITAALGWSHPEHIIELTVADVTELLTLAGFDLTVMRGLWLCYDERSGTVLPFEVIEGGGQWPALRRVACGRENPEDSFCWWAEAVRSDRMPDQAALTKKVSKIYAAAWPERTSRLKSIIGKPVLLRGEPAFAAEQGPEGVLLFGPYMPLRAGAYSVTFTVTADCAEMEPETPIVWCDVFLSHANRAAVTKHVTAAVFTGTDPLQISLDFDLDQLEFGVQFRLISVGAVKVAAVAGVILHEIVRI